MGLVLTALRRPITVMVVVLGIALASILAVRSMSIDIFPNLGLPVIYVAQPYGGLSPSQMEGYVASYYEYHFLYITGIKEVESKSIQGVSLIKLVFHPGTNMSQAMAETVSYVNRARAFMPPGTVPPFIVRYDAGSVPVGQLTFSSASRPLSEISDMALFKVRPLFASLPGVSAPPPFGGNQRTIVVEVDPDKLRGFGLSPDDVVKAVATGNVITPAGNVRIGEYNRLSPINSVVENIHDLDRLPLHAGAGATVFLRDVGTVKDASDILTGYALVNGHRSIYIPVTKRADASTWSVVQAVKGALPAMRDVLPADVQVAYAFDQSVQVKNSIVGLVLEISAGTLLTGLMVLAFLRDWRSALIVVATIPIAILSAVVALALAGQSVNLMTLGGLALAVGVLVDQATVTIENIHRHLASGRPPARAIADACSEVFVPLLLAMLCILAVFVPSFAMTGVPRGLFAPLSLAVGFSLVASFVISQTFVPVLTVWVLGRRQEQHAEERSFFVRLKARYTRTLKHAFAWQTPFVIAYVLVGALGVYWLATSLGTELFPSGETTQFKLRLRAQPGVRVERTEELTLKALDLIAKEVGSENVEATLAFVGAQPSSYPINSIYLWTSGSHEAVIAVALKHKPAVSIETLKEYLRHDIASELPGTSVSFEPGDLVGQVLSQGATTPIEIAVVGKQLEQSRKFAESLRRELSKLSYLRDLAYGQALEYPTVRVDVDRERAGQLGLTMEQIGRSFVVGTSSSRFIQPNYWLFKPGGTAYQVQVEIPPVRIASLGDLETLPATPAGPSADRARPLLRDVARISYGSTVGEYDRLNNQRMVTLTANLSGKDLGSATRNIQRVIKSLGAPPGGTRVVLRGQSATMLDTLGELQNGLLIAIAAIFIVLAANFQSLKLSLAVVSTIPAVLFGALLALWLTGSTLNIQSYMGAIMAVGVAIANAILLVTFAEAHRREADHDVTEAAVSGATSRLRPILMTSCAMMAGMLPMALGLTTGGEQTAPLGRAVIGGLFVGTLATLTVLPLVFALLQRRSGTRSISLDPTDPTSPLYEGAPREASP